MLGEIKGYSTNSGEKKYKKSMSINEKVDLIEEYIKETNKKINGKTVYKGVLIGRMVIQIRHLILTSKVKYSDEIIERLQKAGLLDSIFEKTEDRVKRLEKYCEKNLQMWYLRSTLFVKYLKTTENDFISADYKINEDDVKRFLKDYEVTPVILSDNVDSDESEIKVIINELRQAVYDYICIINKKRQYALKEEDMQKLRNAGVGGRFAYNAEFKLLNEKANIDIDWLKQIVMDFGSIDNFRKIYIKFISTWEIWKSVEVLAVNKFIVTEEYTVQVFGSVHRFKKFMKLFRQLAKKNKLVTFFDLTKDGFIPSEEARVLAYFTGLEYSLGTFFNEQALENIEKTFSNKENKILEEVIKSNGQKSYVDIGREYNLTRSRIGQIEKRISKKIVEQENDHVWYTLSSQIRRKRFIEKYFEEKDIFITPESFELSEDLKIELLNIVGANIDENNNLTWEPEDLNVELKELIKDLKFGYQELNRRLEKDPKPKKETIEI